MKTYNYFPRPNTIIIEASRAWADQYEHLELPRGNHHASLKNCVRYEVNEEEFSEWLSCADYYKTCGQSAYGWGSKCDPYYLGIGSAARGFIRQMERKGLTVNGKINEDLFK